MTRRRYVQINGELIEVGSDYEPPPRDAARQAGLLWNDRAYQDANDPRFSSRTQHREFMKANGLTTVDDFKETWRNAEKRRVESRAGIDPTRRRVIEESFRKVSAGYRPHIEKE